MEQRFYDAVEGNPVIAAVKDETGLEAALSSEDIQVLFILYGDVLSISGIVERAKEAGKLVLVHMDLINGLSAKEIAADYICYQTKADGIITTRPAMIKRAKELGLYTVMRFFIIDSMALSNIHKQYASVRPDFIEVLPGVMPKIIRKICRESRIPIIAGGLIMDKEDVVSALDAGAISVSTTNRDVWFM